MPSERRGALSLAGIFGLRMLGLFMLYPVFAVYGRRLPGATPGLIGLALGIYGLTQALLQLPFGLTSDRIGRRPVITGGLVLFVIGSVVAALAHGVWGIIVGRAVQGAGAVGAATLALAADLTRPEQRTKAVGLIGAGIGLAFAIAVVVGPAVNAWIGLAGIFWLTAALGLVGLAVLWTLVPTPRSQRRHREAEAVPALLAATFADGQLRRLYASIFALHAMLAALFLGIPLVLRAGGGIGPGSEWLFYLPVLGLGFLVMLPFVIVAETRNRIKQVALGAVAVLAAAAAALAAAPDGLIDLAVILLCFFSAFTLMEALLPSLVSRLARPEAKGTALGIYSTSQFAGIFAGGALGGWIQSRFGLEGLFIFVAALGVVWWPLLAGLVPPRVFSSRTFAVSPADEGEAARLAVEIERLPGVEDAAVFADDGVAYVRIDRERFDEAALAALLGEGRA